MHKRWRTTLKIGGWSVGGIVVLVGAYLGLLLYPGFLFSNEVEYKNFVAYADVELRGGVEPILAEVETRLSVSTIYDPAAKHDVFFGHGNRVFGALQRSRSKLNSLLIGRPLATALTYNVSSPPHFSHIITFLIPDFENNVLIRPQGGDAIDMVYMLAHEVTHSLVNGRLGVQRATRLPFWKYEGYADYVASSQIRRASNYSFRSAIERLMREDLAWMKNDRGDFTPLTYDCMSKAVLHLEHGYWPTCYFVSRLMVEYQLDVKGLKFEELMSSDVTDVNTLAEMMASISVRKDFEEGQVPVSPDKSLQRSVNHELLGRGRVVSAPCRAPRACVLTGQLAVAELSR